MAITALKYVFKCNQDTFTITNPGAILQQSTLDSILAHLQSSAATASHIISMTLQGQ
jgi:hypothetical protein